MSKLQIGKILTLSALAFLLTACGSVPITGRRQMLLVSDSEVLNLSFQQYSEFKKSASLSSDPVKTALVTRVGQKIALAVETYMKQAGLEQELAGYAWEFNLVNSNDVNAFCMPGGKIVVYTGILPITRDETGLAVVLGHEVAHAIAKHANERMSQQLLTQYGGAALGSVLSKSSAATKKSCRYIIRHWFTIRCCIASLPKARVGGRQIGADFYGDGRLQSARSSRLLAKNVCCLRNKNGRVCQHAPIGRNPHHQNYRGITRSVEVLQGSCWCKQPFASKECYNKNKEVVLVSN